MARITEEIKQNNKIKHKIQFDTNLKNLKEIAEVFETYKDNNEQLYEKVNKLSGEEIDLRKDIEKMEKDILLMEAKYQGIDLLAANVQKENPVEREKQRQRIIAKQLHIEEYKKKNQNLAGERDANEKDISTMFKGLQLAFDELGCNNEKNKYLASDPITKDNCLQYMDVICRRVNDCMLMDDFVTDVKERKKESSDLESTIILPLSSKGRS